MASLIESVRKLHGPTLVEHDNGYDVDVICPECTRLRAEALETASKDDEASNCAAELARVTYPCSTRVVAGTSAAEGKDESARMRLEHLVVQREQLEERMERLDAVVGLIRRDLGEGTSGSSGREPSVIKKFDEPSIAESKDSVPEDITDDRSRANESAATPEGADHYDF